MSSPATANSLYGPQFYGTAKGASRSADIIIPLVLSRVPITSVVDVGCGTGSWLAAFREHGVQDVLGFDGDWVRPEQLKIPADRFVPHDLTVPLPLSRRFDLAICLEVAEHLPGTRAPGLVHDLTNLAPCVLFSAAVPHQGGTNHINEQFLSYWSNLFEQADFWPLDLLRPAIWSNDQIEWWYRQNIIIFAARTHPIFNQEVSLQNANDYLHPRHFQAVMARMAHHSPTLGELVREFAPAVKRSLHSRLHKIAAH